MSDMLWSVGAGMRAQKDGAFWGRATALHTLAATGVGAMQHPAHEAAVAAIGGQFPGDARWPDSGPPHARLSATFSGPEPPIVFAGNGDEEDDEGEDERPPKLKPEPKPSTSVVGEPGGDYHTPSNEWGPCCCLPLSISIERVGGDKKDPSGVTQIGDAFMVTIVYEWLDEPGGPCELEWWEWSTYGYALPGFGTTASKKWEDLHNAGFGMAAKHPIFSAWNSDMAAGSDGPCPEGLQISIIEDFPKIPLGVMADPLPSFATEFQRQIYGLVRVNPGCLGHSVEAAWYQSMVFAQTGEGKTGWSVVDHVFYPPFPHGAGGDPSKPGKLERTKQHDLPGGKKTKPYPGFNPRKYRQKGGPSSHTGRPKKPKKGG